MEDIRLVEADPVVRAQHLLPRFVVGLVHHVVPRHRDRRELELLYLAFDNHGRFSGRPQQALLMPAGVVST